MTRDIIETIDHALADWQTSDDAMRWTPDTLPELGDHEQITVGFDGGLAPVAGDLIVIGYAAGRGRLVRLPST